MAISDNWLNCVRLYDIQKDILLSQTLGTCSENETMSVLPRPGSVTSDGDGNIFVMSHRLDDIAVFSVDGDYKGRIGGICGYKGIPTSFLVTTDGQIAVGDYQDIENWVKIFNYRI